MTEELGRFSFFLFPFQILIFFIFELLFYHKLTKLPLKSDSHAQHVTSLLNANWMELTKSDGWPQIGDFKKLVIQIG